MNSFTFWCPTKVVFGEGTVGQTGGEAKDLGATNALVIYGGGSAVKSGTLDAATASLAAGGIACSCVGGVRPNPSAEFAQEIVD